MKKQDAKNIVKKMVVAAGVGTQEKLAKIFGIQPQSISSNIAKGSVPERWFEIIEEKFGIPKHELTFLGNRQSLLTDLSLNEPQCDYSENQDREITGKAISEMLYKTTKVLESKTVYRSALASNINAFYEAIQGEEEMSKLGDKIEEQNDRINSLTSAVETLTRKLEENKIVEPIKREILNN